MTWACSRPRCGRRWPSPACSCGSSWPPSASARCSTGWARCARSRGCSLDGWAWALDHPDPDAAQLHPDGHVPRRHRDAGDRGPALCAAGGPLGFDLIWYGVLYTITCQIAYMTPPFGYNLFLMRAMAPPEISLGDIYRSIIPFVGVMMLALASHDGLPADRALAAVVCLRSLTRRQERSEDRPNVKEGTMTTKRSDLMTKDAIPSVARRVAAASPSPPPAIAQSTIRWRMQTYAGPALAEHVIKPAIDHVQQDRQRRDGDRALLRRPARAHGRALPRHAARHHRRRAVDDDSMASPTEVTVFGGYFPFASRYSLDVPVLFNHWGLNEIWEEEYAERSASSTGSPPAPGIPATSPPRTRSARLADLQGKRVFTFPTAGRFLAVRRRPGHPALGGHRGRGADRRARRHRLVRHHRGLHGGLGRRDQLLPDQQHLGRLDRLISSPTWTAGTSCPTTCRAVPGLHGQLPLLPPALVLGRRGRLRATATSWS
jgi:hypothetical protein